MSQGALQDKAGEFWKRIVKLETEKYDLEIRINSSDKRLLRRVSTQRLLPESTHLRSRLHPSLRDAQTAGRTRTRRNSLRVAENWKSRRSYRNSGNLRKLSSKADRRSAFPNGSVSAQARRRVKPIPKVRRKKKKRI